MHMRMGGATRDYQSFPVTPKHKWQLASHGLVKVSGSHYYFYACAVGLAIYVRTYTGVFIY